MPDALMARPLTIVGVQFASAAPAVRRALALTPAAIAAAEEHLATRAPGIEAVIVGTCARTELIVAGLPLGDVLRLWHDAIGAGGEALCLAPPAEPFVFEDRAAVRHLFEVACGLHSPLLGEHEVLSQLRDAHLRASERGLVGSVLRRLFRDAFAVGKRARSATAIAAGGAGIGLAVAEAVADRRPDGRCLVIGAGSGGRAIARRLARRSPHPVTIVSRTRSHADALAASVGGRGAGWERLDAELVRHDAIVVAVEAGTTVLARSRLERLAAHHAGWAPLIVDVGAAQCVEPWAGAEHIGLAELSERRDQLAAVRAAAVPAVETLIDVALGRRPHEHVEVLA